MSNEAAWLKFGGPAFPAENDETYFKGMTKREWFAGQALAGLLAYRGGPADPERYAEKAFRIADVMLAEARKNEQ